MQKHFADYILGKVGRQTIIQSAHRRHFAIKNFRGIGLLESLIAALLLVIVALGIAAYVTGSFSTGINLREASTCQIRANQVLENLNRFDNKIFASTWHATSTTPAAPALPAGLVSFAGLLSLSLTDLSVDQVYPATALPTEIANATHVSRMLFGTTTLLESLYNRVDAAPFCTLVPNSRGHQIQVGDFGYPATGAIAQAGAAGAEQIFLKIVRKNISGAESCLNSGGATPGTLDASPMGANQAPAANHLQQGESLRVTATVVMPDGKDCRQVAEYRYQADLKVTPTMTRLDANPSLTGTASLLVSADEPAVVFFCLFEKYSNYALPAIATTSWSHCNLLTDLSAVGAGIKMQLTDNTALVPGQTSFKAVVSGMPTGNYALSLLAIDSAKNFSLNKVQIGVVSSSCTAPMTICGGNCVDPTCLGSSVWNPASCTCVATVCYNCVGTGFSFADPTCTAAKAAAPVLGDCSFQHPASRIFHYGAVLPDGTTSTYCTCQNANVCDTATLNSCGTLTIQGTCQVAATCSGSPPPPPGCTAPQVACTSPTTGPGCYDPCTTGTLQPDCTCNVCPTGQALGCRPPFKLSTGSAGEPVCGICAGTDIAYCNTPMGGTICFSGWPMGMPPGCKDWPALLAVNEPMSLTCVPAVFGKRGCILSPTVVGDACYPQANAVCDHGTWTGCGP